MEKVFDLNTGKRYDIQINIKQAVLGLEPNTFMELYNFIVINRLHLTEVQDLGFDEFINFNESSNMLLVVKTLHVVFQNKGTLHNFQHTCQCTFSINAMSSALIFKKKENLDRHQSNWKLFCKSSISVGPVIVTVMKSGEIPNSIFL